MWLRLAPCSQPRMQEKCRRTDVAAGMRRKATGAHLSIVPARACAASEGAHSAMRITAQGDDLSTAPFQCLGGTTMTASTLHSVNPTTHSAKAHCASLESDLACMMHQTRAQQVCCHTYRDLICALPTVPACRHESEKKESGRV